MVLKRTVRVFVFASRCYHMASAVAWLELGPAPGSSSPCLLELYDAFVALLSSFAGFLSS